MGTIVAAVAVPVVLIAGVVTVHQLVEGGESNITLTQGDLSDLKGVIVPKALGQTKFIILAEHWPGNVYWYPFDDESKARAAFGSYWTTSRLLYDLSVCGVINEVLQGGPAFPYNTLRGAMRKMA